MNNTTLSGILSALLIVGGSWLISLFTCGSGSADSSAAKFSLLDGTLKTKETSAFTFGVSGTKPTIPKETANSFQAASDHLKNNENRTLELTGLYYSSEKSTGDINLGMARAESIKKQLVKMGAPEESISTASMKLSNLQSADKVFNPVVFNFSEKKTEELSEVDPIEYPFTPLDPFTMRFETSKSDLVMTADLRSYLDQALTYLEANPGTQFMIAGYTDSEGSSTSNKTLSRNRARTVREFLKENGIDGNQITISGKGESNPVEDNATKEGRAQNRRVEITIK